MKIELRRTNWMGFTGVTDRLVGKFCVWLGRYGSWSTVLDRIAGLFCPSFVQAPFLPAAAGDAGPLLQPIFMAVSSKGPVFNNALGHAPSNLPNGGDPQDPPHNAQKCAPMRYHGMHGAPCAYHGGTDKSCPPGAVAGLWWRFNIPSIGNVYYVDCCGLAMSWTVWCRWASEQNWCGGIGRNIYTCTMTLLQSEMHVGPDGFYAPR